jgi:hypothetical protein
MRGCRERDRERDREREREKFLGDPSKRHHEAL